MIRSILSSSVATAAGLALAAATMFGSFGCQPSQNAAEVGGENWSPVPGPLKAGMSLARVRQRCAQPPCQLVSVEETENAADEPVPGAYYFADVCPDCGGAREVFCTLYFDGRDRLVCWHQGRIDDDPRAVTIAGKTLRPGMSVADARKLFGGISLVTVDEEHTMGDKAVPGAYYAADICPDCGGLQTIFGTLYFDKAGRLFRWHEGYSEEEAERVANVPTVPGGTVTK
jgi:rRNA maturation protein Nop10